MSIKNKLLVILSIIILILSLYTVFTAWNIIKCRNQLIVVNDALNDMYMITQIRTGINSQIKKITEYLISGKENDKIEFEEYRNKILQSLDNFIKAEQTGISKKRAHDQLHLEIALEIKEAYNSMSDNILETYSSYPSHTNSDINKTHFHLELKIEHQLFEKLDAIFESEITDIDDSYNETLLNIGSMLWSRMESKKQIIIARTAFDYFVAVQNSSAIFFTMMHEITDYILFGNEKYKNNYEKHKIIIDGFFSDWLKALHTHKEMGVEGEDEDISNVMSIRENYNVLINYFEEASLLKEQGKSLELLRLLEGKVEPLMNNILMPGILDATTDSQVEISDAHSKLLSLIIKAGIKIFAIISVIFASILIITLRLIKSILKVESNLRELNRDLTSRVNQEIEARREKEQRLIQQSKIAAMGEMIGAIAHQWRQPLNALGIIIQDIQDAYESGELDRKYMDNSVRDSLNQLQYMSKTIDEFRNFYRESKNKDSFNIVNAVKSALSLQEAQIRHSDISIQINTGKSDNLTVNAYPNEFKQVILNILSNARGAILEARSEGILDNKKGTISINIAGQKGNIMVTIANNGKNIPQEIADRIFEPYFTTKKTPEGTGIGLYMSKTIIEKHMKGRLYFTNIKEGVIFTIDLPAADLKR